MPASAYRRSTVAAASALAAVTQLAAAGPVSAVNELPDASILHIDAPPGANDPFGPLVFTTSGGSVTATATTEFISSGVIQDPALTGFFDNSTFLDIFPERFGAVDPAVNPGDWHGRFDVDKVLTLNFDTPLAGVGFTLHNAGTGNMSTGSIITVYSAPDATGVVLGTVTSPDSAEICCPYSTPPPYDHLYFRGIHDVTGSIRSVTLTPTNASMGWGIDTIAISAAGGPSGCNVADLAEPFGVLDFSDVVAFLTAFGSMDSAADLAPPVGVFDFSDVVAFLGSFGAGCP